MKQGNLCERALIESKYLYLCNNNNNQKYNIS